MAVLLAPASWLQIPGVSVRPEVVTFRVPVEMEPDPITLDLTGTDREVGGGIRRRRAAGGVRVQRSYLCHSQNTEE